MCNLSLAQKLQLNFLLLGNHRYHIRIRAETTACNLKVIGNHHINILLIQLHAGIFQHILGFHGEAAVELTFSAMLAQIFQNILCSVQFDRHFAVLFLCFFITVAFGLIIRNRRRLDDDIIIQKTRLHCLKHIPCALYLHIIHKHRGLQICHTADKCYLRAAQHCRLRQLIAHFSCGVVCNITHRVYAFLCRTCGDNHFHAGKVFFMRDFTQDMPHQNVLRGHFSIPDIPTGKQSLFGRNHRKAIALQLFQIILQNGVMIHIGIHGRRNDFLTGARHSRCRQHIIRNAVCQLANHICGSRRNQKHIRLFRDGNMCHMELEIAVEGIYHTFIAGQCFKGNRRNKLAGIFRHDHMHIRMQLHEHACHICHFIRSNAACYTQNNSFPF